MIKYLKFVWNTARSDVSDEIFPSALCVLSPSLFYSQLKKTQSSANFPSSHALFPREHQQHTSSHRDAAHLRRFSREQKRKSRARAFTCPFPHSWLGGFVAASGPAKQPPTHPLVLSSCFWLGWLVEVAATWPVGLAHRQCQWVHFQRQSKATRIKQ